MSMMYYIAANKELPLSESGGKEVKAIRFKSVELQQGQIPLEQIIDLPDLKADEIKEYDSYEDAAGICVQNLEPGDEAIRQQFKNQFVYKIWPNWGNFFFDEGFKNSHPSAYRVNRKCLEELFTYIRRHLEARGEAEIYTCWADDEGAEKNHKLDMVIDLKTFQLGDSFALKAGQYILIKN